MESSSVSECSGTMETANTDASHKESGSNILESVSRERKMTIEELTSYRQRRRTQNLAELRRVLTLVLGPRENLCQFDTLLQDEVSVGPVNCLGCCNFTNYVTAIFRGSATACSISLTRMERLGECRRLSGWNPSESTFGCEYYRADMLVKF